MKKQTKEKNSLAQHQCEIQHTNLKKYILLWSGEYLSDGGACSVDMRLKLCHRGAGGGCESLRMTSCE